LWFKDNGTDASTAGNNRIDGFAFRQICVIQKPDPKGTFSFRIPLKHIFGFCDDFEKVVYGFKHQLTLVRKGDNDAIFRAAATDAGKVLLSKFSWYMLHVLPNDQQKLVYYSTKQLNQNQVSHLVTEWFNATRSQSNKREISPGDCQ